MRHYSELAHQTVNTTCVIPKSNTDTFCLKSLHTGKSESLLAALSSQAPFDFIKSVGLQPFSNLSGGIQPRSDLGSCSAARVFYRVVLNPLLVLLEAQPTPSRRSRALWSWLSSSCLYIHLSSTLTVSQFLLPKFIPTL